MTRHFIDFHADTQAFVIGEERVTNPQECLRGRLDISLRGTKTPKLVSGHEHNSLNAYFSVYLSRSASVD